MLLFGEEPYYLSHLARSHVPRNVQVLLEVCPDHLTAQALERDPGALYTFDPTDLPIAVLDPYGDGSARTSPEARLVRGHVGRDGTPIADGARFDVRRVVRFRELDIHARTQIGQELRYVCFGRPGRLYLVHEVKARPSFEQVLVVRMVPGTVRTQTGNALDEDVRRYGFDTGQQVGVGRDDLVGQRLVVGETVTAWFDLTHSLTGTRGFTVQMAAERELYLDVDELG